MFAIQNVAKIFSHFMKKSIDNIKIFSILEYWNTKVPFQGGMLTKFLRNNQYKTERLSYNQVLSTYQLMFWNKRFVL